MDTVQSLSRARDLDTIMAIVRDAARDLTGADGATFVLRDGDRCYYAEENAIAPLWKGQRFPMDVCISGWVMLNGQAAVIEDVFQDSRIPADVYRPTFVKSLAMVPIRVENPVGAIGNYWARHRQPSEEELDILGMLANFTSVAMENGDLYARLESKIEALEQTNLELETFAWAASHDLKAPLRGIHNLATLIDQDISDGEPDGARKHAEALRRRANRMSNLLYSITEYAGVEQRADPDRQEICDGKTLREDIIDVVDIPDEFEVRFSTSLDSARLPRAAAQRVFCNLIANAIKHHDRNRGLINIDCREDRLSYRLTVDDDGPGVPPEFRERIFEMFQTLKSRDITEGSGMGLALARKILNAQGGTISVESSPEGGARFEVIWPKPASRPREAV